MPTVAELKTDQFGEKIKNKKVLVKVLSDHIKRQQAIIDTLTAQNETLRRRCWELSDSVRKIKEQNSANG